MSYYLEGLQCLANYKHSVNNNNNNISYYYYHNYCYKYKKIRAASIEII